MIVIVDNASMLLQNSLSEDANQATSQSILAEPSPVEKSARQAWLGACLQVGFSYFITHADKPIADDIVTKYREGIAKLEQGVPLAYVIGRQGFWRHEFKVNQYTLIPRPDTETLVETVLNLAKNRFNLAHSLRLLDLGTGSGCIAISLAAEQPNWQVTATDFSTQALAVAQHNAQQINWLSRWQIANTALPTPPDLIIGAGHSTHIPVWLMGRRYRQAKTLIVMKPSLPLSWFDFVMMPEHDAKGSLSNHVLLTQGVMNRFVNEQRHQANKVLILLGGTNQRYAFDSQKMLADIQTLINFWFFWSRSHLWC